MIEGVHALYGMRLACVRQHMVLSVTADEHPVWRGHRKEATRCTPCGPRVTRTWCAMVALLLTCSTTWWSLLAVWCVRGATHRGQPWMPALPLPHVRDGLRVLRLAMFSTWSM